MIESQDEYVSLSDGMKLAGVKRGMFYYFVNDGRIKQGPGKAQFSKADCLQIKLDRQQRRKREASKPDPLLYDWIKPGDILATLELDRELYTSDNTDYEIDYNEPLHYQERQKKNPTIAMGAFTPDRLRCLGYVSLIPLPEPVILAIMAGNRDELSIQLAEVETYERAGGYTLFCNSAAVSREYPYLLYKIIKRIMAAWVDRFPERYITRIYAQAASDEGRAMIAHFFLAPMSGYPDNNYYLDFARTNPSHAINQFLDRLTAIAPLPSDMTTLYTPPLPTTLQASETAQKPRVESTKRKQAETPRASEPRTEGEVIMIGDAASQLGISRVRLFEMLVTPANKKETGLVTNESNGLQHYARRKGGRDERTRSLTQEQLDAVRAWRDNNRLDGFMID